MNYRFFAIKSKGEFIYDYNQYGDYVPMLFETVENAEMEAQGNEEIVEVEIREVNKDE